MWICLRPLHSTPSLHLLRPPWDWFRWSVVTFGFLHNFGVKYFSSSSPSGFKNWNVKESAAGVRITACSSLQLQTTIIRKNEQSLLNVEAMMLHGSLASIMLMDSWEEDVVSMVEKKHGKNHIVISFECQTLKSEQAAEDHIRQFIPKLAGQDAVVNIGPMSIRGLDFEAEEQPEE